MTPTLRGRRRLINEDEHLIATDLAEALAADGAEVMGPVSSVDQALDLLVDAERLDGAVLDLNLQGEMAFPVADALIRLAIPFVFATSYDRAAIPARYQNIHRCEKPATVSNIARALYG